MYNNDERGLFMIFEEKINFLKKSYECKEINDNMKLILKNTADKEIVLTENFFW